MKSRVMAVSLLIVSLALNSSPSHTVAQSPGPGAAASPVSAQRQTHNVETVGHIGGGAEAVAVRDDYAYVGIGPRLVILDVVDPAQPAFVGQTCVLPDRVQDVAVEGNYAYIAVGSAGLWIVNISNPTAPIVSGLDADKGPAIEDTLALYYWDGSQWTKELSSTVNTVSQTITATPNHLSLWHVLGETRRVYLPIILSQG